MSRRHHTAHDLASLRIDLFGETAKSSTQVFGRKARGIVDKGGNVLATAPFKKRKRQAIERENSAREGPGEPTLPGVDIHDEALKSGRLRKKKRTYYPGILPYLEISESTRNEQPTADLLKRIHRFACEYYSDRGVLYDASRKFRDPDHTSSSRRMKDKDLMVEFKPTPTIDTVHGEDGKGDHSESEMEMAISQPTERSLHKNMTRAFDGTALITIGMLLQEHITSFLQRAPMDPDEWENILFEEGEREKKQNEWRMKRSKPRRVRPQVTNRASKESSASGSGSEGGETSEGDEDDEGGEDGTEEGPLEGSGSESNRDSSGASSDSRAQ